jgi:hypothetical protein
VGRTAAQATCTPAAWCDQHAGSLRNSTLDHWQLPGAIQIDPTCQDTTVTLGVYDPSFDSLQLKCTADHMTSDTDQTALTTSGNKRPVRGHQFLWGDAKQ